MSKIKHFLKVVLIFFDKKILVPITKFFLWISEKTNKNGKGFEQLISKKSSLIIISLVLALITFFFVDAQSIALLENSAEVIYNQPVNAIYNEEAYVIEGIPETVDITLIGRKSDLYLAKQLQAHEVAIDLSDLKPGTHKVSLKYKGSIETINYKLDPSIASVTIYPKVSEVRTINTDILNQDDLDSKLTISKVEIDRQEVIIKGAEYKLKKVATVKALVDINKLSTTAVGTVTLNDISLIAYDEEGNVVNIEMVPSKVSASVTIESPKKVVPIKIIPVGEVAFGKAISSITSNISSITIYGDQTSLDKISYISAQVDVKDISDKKNVTLTLKKPSGVRYMSENSTVVTVVVEAEITKEIQNILIENKNLSDKYLAYAASESDRYVDVIIKGVESVLNELDVTTIKAYVDLSGYGIGKHEVSVVVEGTDLRITYVPKIKTINVIISKKS